MAIKTLTPTLTALPLGQSGQVAQLGNSGIRLILCYRHDGEGDYRPTFAESEAATKAGIAVASGLKARKSVIMMARLPRPSISLAAV